MASKKTQERLAKLVKGPTQAEAKPDPKPVEPAQSEKARVEETQEEGAKYQPKRVSKEMLAAVRHELLAQAKGAGLSVEETSGVFKILGKGKLWLSVAKNGATVNLLGFCVDGASPVSEAEAKARHIGRTRGQLDMSEDRGKVVAAFAKALAALQVASVLALFIR